ncbi:Inorganic pyrophosphatase [Thalictrum thalictroides]|uniref:Inorganic pyrophosphatase n=1 Tax=Thalictrum thalictroides TaxID=46969 RepID=A0A7J6X490_THATH|nr:Inorganic pyrophosphatase [Thalictrum thalictroides]
MSGIVVIFDFDKTLIDCDSDNWLIDQLGATHRFNQLLPTMPWNTVMMTIPISSQEPLQHAVSVPRLAYHHGSSSPIIIPYKMELLNQREVQLRL